MPRKMHFIWFVLLAVLLSSCGDKQQTVPPNSVERDIEAEPAYTQERQLYQQYQEAYHNRRMSLQYALTVLEDEDVASGVTVEQLHPGEFQPSAGAILSRYEKNRETLFYQLQILGESGQMVENYIPLEKAVYVQCFRVYYTGMTGGDLMDVQAKALF